MTVANLNILYLRQRLFWRCLFIVALLLVSHIYLVKSTVFNLMTRERLLASLNETSNNVVALESKYLTLSGQITMDLARNLGFRDAADSTIFVALPAETSVVALSSTVLE